MKKSLLEIYALAVCFVTILCFSVVLGVGLYDILEMSNPEMTMKSYQYQKHQTNEGFSKNWSKEKRKISDAELTKLREKSYEVALKSEKRGAVQSFVRVLIMLSIGIVVFLLHWKLARRARE